MSEHVQVEILCEGNDRVGFGHLRRSITLANRLRREGVEVRISGLSAEARRFLPPVEHERRKAHVLVFDAPEDIEALLQQAKAEGKICVALDWFGETVPDVNIAVYPHHEVRSRLASYIGFEYILIREEIAALHVEPSGARGKKVLIMLGGGDLLNQGHEIAGKLAFQGYEVTLVQGPLAANQEPGNEYEVLVNPPDLPQLIASSDWMVTNGGGSLFEAMCAGKAVVVLPQTDAEQRVAQYVEGRGAVIGIGADSLLHAAKADYAAIAGKAFDMVDGKGVVRVSDIVQGLL